MFRPEEVIMYLQAFLSWIFFLEDIRVVLVFSFVVSEVIGNFAFSVTRASGVSFGNHKRRWKAGLEGYLMKVIRSACVHIQCGIFCV